MRKALDESIRDAIVFEVEVAKRKPAEVAKDFGMSPQHIYQARKLAWYKERLDRVKVDGDLVREMPSSFRGKLFRADPPLVLDNLDKRRILVFVETGLDPVTIGNSYRIDREEVYDIADALVLAED